MKIVSGIRPTGEMHLGNYLGAVKQWKKLQDEHDCYFFVADMHVDNCFTDDVIKTSDQLKAVGVKNVHVQSVKRDELLHCFFHDLFPVCSVGQLLRMTQYKDKGEGNAFLLTYPILMAADILVNGADLVPVGSDQMQHLELARDLCDRLDGRYKKPEALLSSAPRVMSLKDGTKKMSKSDGDDYSRINVTDSLDLIHAKLKAAKTSNLITDETPEAINLRTIYAAVGGTYFHTKWMPFKEELANLIYAEFRK